MTTWVLPLGPTKWKKRTNTKYWHVTSSHMLWHSRSMNEPAHMIFKYRNVDKCSAHLFCDHSHKGVIICALLICLRTADLDPPDVKLSRGSPPACTSMLSTPTCVIYAQPPWAPAVSSLQTWTNSLYQSFASSVPLPTLARLVCSMAASLAPLPTGTGIATAVTHNHGLEPLQAACGSISLQSCQARWLAGIV